MLVVLVLVHFGQCSGGGGVDPALCAQLRRGSSLSLSTPCTHPCLKILQNGLAGWWPTAANLWHKMVQISKLLQNYNNNRGRAHYIFILHLTCALRVSYIRWKIKSEKHIVQKQSLCPLSMCISKVLTSHISSPHHKAHHKACHFTVIEVLCKMLTASCCSHSDLH